MRHLRIFGSECYIKVDEEIFGKFDSRLDEGIFLGYYLRSKAYRCYNKRLKRIVESENVRVDETIQSTGILKVEMMKNQFVTIVKNEKLLQKLQQSMLKKSL